MYALDFEYDGQYLSDYGFVICNIGGASDMDVVSAGSKITFNTVARHYGKKYSLTSTSYDECIQATFDICKNPEFYDDLHITNDEYRNIMRWLNRREFLKFRLLNEDDDYDTCFFMSSFNIDKVVVNKELYGFQLTMETDKPFGYGHEQVVSWLIKDTSKPKILSDMSDEIGHTYPDMTITINQSGNLTIYNELEDCTMVIKNCSAGEVININGDAQIITSSMNSHHLYDDFNFEFFRIGNTFNNRNNKITVSLPCKLELRYTPIIKDTPE